MFVYSKHHKDRFNKVVLLEISLVWFHCNSKVIKLTTKQTIISSNTENVASGCLLCVQYVVCGSAFPGVLIKLQQF